MNRRKFIKKILKSHLLFFMFFSINLPIMISKNTNKIFKKKRKKIWILKSDDF